MTKPKLIGESKKVLTYKYKGHVFFIFREEFNCWQTAQLEGCPEIVDVSYDTAEVFHISQVVKLLGI